MPKKKQGLPAHWTAIDVLIGSCSEAERSPEQVDPEVARVFAHMFMTFASPMGDEDERLVEIARREASIAERAAIGILGTAIGVAREHGSPELYTDVLGLGVWLAMRFSEYAEVFMEGDDERRRTEREADEWRQDMIRRGLMTDDR
jgi:hypothetical protein